MWPANDPAIRTVPHLLVCVTSVERADAVVRHGHRLHQVVGGTWAVVSLETPMSASRDKAARNQLLTALRLAEELGASTSRVNTGSHSTSMLVSAVVHRARSERATFLLLAQPDGAAGPLAQHVEALSNLLPGVSIDVLVAAGGAQGGSKATGSRADLAATAREGLPVALGVLAACTMVSAVMERSFDPINLVLIYLAGVVVVAWRSSRFAALCTVVGGIFLFDLIFVAPRWSLKPTEPQYFFTFAVMLVVGLLVSHLASRSRVQAAMAEGRAHRAQALNQLALQLARARSVEAIADAAAHSARVSLDAQARLLPDADVAQALDAQAAGLALEQGIETGAGTPHRAEAPALYLPLMAAGTALGVLEVSGLRAPHDTPEHYHLLKAMASQTAVALERTLLERRSIEAAIEAESEKLRNTLLSGISHDFRTPLTTIVGAATSLIEQGYALDDAHRLALLHSVLGEARRMHVLMSDLLDLTRMQEGAVRPTCEWCPAEDLVGEAIAGIETRLQLHDVHVSVAHDAVVWCDPRLVGQALVNLLDNAARYTPPGGRIDVRVVTLPGRWRLVVEDNGPGLPAGQEREVFKKFSRGRHEPAGGGTGLGLAICAAVAQLHAGSIDARTVRGACFTMSFAQPEAGPPAVEDA